MTNLWVRAAATIVRTLIQIMGLGVVPGRRLAPGSPGAFRYSGKTFRPQPVGLSCSCLRSSFASGGGQLAGSLHQYLKTHQPQAIR